MPGSGLSVNIGRSLRLEGGPSAEAHRHAERLHKAIVKGYVPRFVNLTRACDGGGGGGGGDGGGCARESIDLQAYDSVQFPLRAHNSWGAERWTEIVLLRGGHEVSFVTALSLTLTLTVILILILTVTLILTLTLNSHPPPHPPPPPHLSRFTLTLTLTLTRRASSRR